MSGWRAIEFSVCTFSISQWLYTFIYIVGLRYMYNEYVYTNCDLIGNHIVYCYVNAMSCIYKYMQE